MVTHYLEFVDDSSAKFWMIEVNGTSHTVTYGKLGSAGRSSEKAFDTPAEARASATKLVQKKRKKGYVDTARRTGGTRRVLTAKEANERYALKQYDPIGLPRYPTIVVFEGDVTITGDLNKQTVEKVFFEGDRTPTDDLVIIDGSLSVRGCLELDGYHPCLLVLGDLRCELMTSLNAYKHITGDAFIEIAFFGNYNHGGTFIDGTLHVPLLMNSDHGCEITVAPDTVCINYFNDDDDFFEYAFTAKDLPRLFPDPLFEWHTDVDYDFEWYAVVESLKAGRSPFRDGVDPIGETGRDAPHSSSSSHRDDSV